MALKLTTHNRSRRATPARLVFPARAAAELADLKHARDRRPSHSPQSVPLPAMSHDELVRGVECTLARIQAQVDQVQEYVENYRFPGERQPPPQRAFDRDADPPRAA